MLAGFRHSVEHRKTFKTQRMIERSNVDLPNKPRFLYNHPSLSLAVHSFSSDFSMTLQQPFPGFFLWQLRFYFQPQRSQLRGRHSVFGLLDSDPFGRLNSSFGKLGCWLWLVVAGGSWGMGCFMFDLFLHLFTTVYSLFPDFLLLKCVWDCRYCRTLGIWFEDDVMFELRNHG